MGLFENTNELQFLLVHEAGIPLGNWMGATISPDHEWFSLFLSDDADQKVGACLDGAFFAFAFEIKPDAVTAVLDRLESTYGSSQPSTFTWVEYLLGSGLVQRVAKVARWAGSTCHVYLVVKETGFVFAPYQLWVVYLRPDFKDLLASKYAVQMQAMETRRAADKERDVQRALEGIE